MAGELNVSLVLRATDRGFSAEVAGSEAELRDLGQAARTAGDTIGARISAGTAKATEAMRGFGRTFARGLRGSVGNIGQQLQDVFVQIQAGVDPLIVLGQQLPQAFVGFGPQGAIAGAVIAFGALAANVFLRFGDDAESAAERAAKSFDEAMDRITTSVADGLPTAEKIVETFEKLPETLRRAQAREFAGGARQGVESLEAQRSRFQALIGDLEGLAFRSELRQVGVGRQLEGDLTFAQIEQIRALAEGAREGRIGVDELADSLGEMAAQAPLLEELAGQVGETATKLAQTAEALRQTREALPAVEDLVSGTGQQFDLLGTQLDAVQGKVGETTGSFKTMYDEVVGRSYVPDMVTESQLWFDRLSAHMTSTTSEATGNVADAFSGLDRQVSGTLARMITSNKLALSDFADFSLDIANQILTAIIQIGIQTGLNVAFAGSGAGAGAHTGAGMSTSQAMTSSGVLHAGGIVGEGGARRLVDAMLFAGAPRMHRGGTILRPGEVPIIAQRGERVIPAGQAAGPQMIVNINNESGGQVETTRRRGPGGVDILDVVIRRVANGMMGGDFDLPMASRFGLRPGRPG